RILVASRRPWLSDAFATWSYEMYFVPNPLSADTFVNAAVSVVFPWSTCPIVPTFTCGLLRSNLAFAMSLLRKKCEARARDRTADLILTKDVLYQLSYASGCS